MHDALAKPLLTIAVPTFNRATDLSEFLDVLLPQLNDFPQIEVLISDNASTDRTIEVIETATRRWTVRGAALRVQRHATNIGADSNFASCYQEAKGHFFWLCGDDDRITPGAIADVVQILQTPDGLPSDVDLVYATSYGYRSNFMEERRKDPLNRHIHVIRDPLQFATAVNIMFTFISGIIVNRSRLELLPHLDPREFIDTNLVQLSWSLPLLLNFRKGIVLWKRPVAARLGNAHGYAVGKVFGVQLATVLTRILSSRPDLIQRILRVSLRQWFPAVMIDLRSSNNQTMGMSDAHQALKKVFGSERQYWLFTYPAIAWPLFLARLYTKGMALLSKGSLLLFSPRFWRREIL